MGNNRKNPEEDSTEHKRLPSNTPLSPAESLRTVDPAFCPAAAPSGAKTPDRVSGDPADIPPAAGAGAPVNWADVALDLARRHTLATGVEHVAKLHYSRGPDFPPDIRIVPAAPAPPTLEPLRRILRGENQPLRDGSYSGPVAELFALACELAYRKGLLALGRYPGATSVDVDGRWTFHANPHDQEIFVDLPTDRKLRLPAGSIVLCFEGWPVGVVFVSRGRWFSRASESSEDAACDALFHAIEKLPPVSDPEAVEPTPRHPRFDPSVN